MPDVAGSSSSRPGAEPSRSSHTSGTAIGQRGDQHADDEQGARPRHRRFRSLRQGLREPVAALPEVAEVPVVEVPAVVQHAQRDVGLPPLGHAEVEGELDVRVLAIQPGHPVHLSRAEPVRVGRGGQLLAPVPVPAAQRPVLATVAQVFLTVLADGFEQPVPRSAAGALGDQDRLGDQGRHEVRDLLRREVVARAHPLDGVQLEAAAEHREAGPELLFRGGAQLVTPADRGPQGLHAG